MFKLISNYDHPAGCSIDYSIGLAVEAVQGRQEECDFSFNGVSVVIGLEDTAEDVLERWQAGMKAAAEGNPK